MNTDAVKRLDSLKDHTEAESRAAVIRQALRVYEWMIEELVDSKKALYIGESLPEQDIPSQIAKLKVFAG